MPLLFFVALQKGARQVAQYLDEIEWPGGLTGTDALVLSYLDVYGPCTVTRLNEEFGLRASTLTNLLRRIEQAGLLLRQRHPRDSRAWLLEPSERGRLVADRVHSALEALEGEVQIATSEQEVEGFETVIKILTRATRAAHRRMEAGREGPPGAGALPTA